MGMEQSNSQMQEDRFESGTNPSGVGRNQLRGWRSASRMFGFIDWPAVVQSGRVVLAIYDLGRGFELLRLLIFETA